MRLIIGGLARLGYIGVFGALYTCACLVVLHRCIGVDVDPMTVLSCSALACAVFLLDRVKPSDRFEDKGDIEAHPARHAFVWKHRFVLRWMVVVLALAAAAGLTLHAPSLGPLPVLALGGVLIYGSLPRRPRPKDVLIVKNAAVAASITALCVAIASADMAIDRLATLPVAAGAAIVFGQVLLDAMLCDIDDLDADRTFGTITLPVKFGVSTTWIVAAMLQFLVVAIWIRIADASEQPPAYFATMCLALPASFGAMYLVRPQTIRDGVDVRLPIIVAIGELALLASGGSIG